MEEQRSENTAVGRLAHRHDYPGTDAGQQEGLRAAQQEVSEDQQEGHGADQQEVSEGQQEGNFRRHPRNISILRPPPHNPQNHLAQRLEELVARYDEVSESLMPAVTRARQIIEENISDLNFRDATIRTFFFA